MESTTIETGDSVENIFCIPFGALPKYPMDKETAELMIQLMFSGDAVPNIPEKDKPFLYKIIESRASASFTVKITDVKLILFLCVLTKTPGIAVMYLTYLQYWAKKNNVKEITFDNFCSRIFPNGFPSESDLHSLWLMQKVEKNGGSYNLLDYQSAMRTIQFEE